jgi:hypothetical protein
MMQLEKGCSDFIAKVYIFMTEGLSSDIRIWNAIETRPELKRFISCNKSNKLELVFVSCESLTFLSWSHAAGKITTTLKTTLDKEWSPNSSCYTLPVHPSLMTRKTVVLCLSVFHQHESFASESKERPHGKKRPHVYFMSWMICQT